MNDNKTWRLNRFQFDSILIISIILAPLVNFSIGVGENVDSYLYLSRAKHFATTHQIFPTRSWGFPIYEALVYSIINSFGLTVAKAYSYGLFLVSLLFLYRMFLQFRNDIRSSLVSTACIGSIPAVLIAANTILETSQGICTFTLFLFFLSRYARELKNLDFHCALLALTLATGTRPDFIIFFASLFILELLKLFPREMATDSIPIKSTWVPKAQASKLLIIALYSCLGLLPYFLFYTKNTLFNFSIVSTGDLFSIKLIKVLVSFVTIAGIPATLYWVTITLSNRKVFEFLNVQKLKAAIQERLKSNVSPDILGTLLIISTPLFLVRFILLPDEIEYYLSYFILGMIVLLKRSRLSKIYITTLLMFSSQFFCITAFDREPSGRIILRPGITAGILEQERQSRAQNEYIHNHAIHDFSDDLEKINCKWLEHQLSSAIFFEPNPDLASLNTCVIVSLKWLSRLRDYIIPSQGKDLSKVLANNELQIYLHPMKRSRGWRRLLSYYRHYPIRNKNLLRITHENLFSDLQSFD